MAEETYTSFNVEVGQEQDSSHLQKQTLDDLDVSTLTPLSPQVISRQATINIGTIGHVAHGKSTVVRAISGVQTVRFRNEIERNLTIKLGYANAKIYKCDNPECPRPNRYQAFGSNMNDTPDCPRVGCESKMTLMRCARPAHARPRPCLTSAADTCPSWIALDTTFSWPRC